MAKIRQFGGVTDASVQALETYRVVDEAEAPAAAVEAVVEEPEGDEDLEDAGEDDDLEEPAEAPAAADYSKMRKPELQAALAERGADTEGTVPELRARLADLDASVAA